MDRLAPIEAATGLEFVLQISPLDQLHDVVEMPFLLAKAIEANDVGMLELLEGLDFGLEPLAKALLDGQPRAEDFNGRRLTGFDIFALIDGPHPTTADPLTDAIGSQLLEFHSCNLTRRPVGFHTRRSGPVVDQTSRWQDFPACKGLTPMPERRVSATIVTCRHAIDYGA